MYVKRSDKTAERGISEVEIPTFPPPIPNIVSALASDASTTCRFGATEIGLAIGKKLFGLMGGNIGARESGRRKTRYGRSRREI